MRSALAGLLLLALAPGLAYAQVGAKSDLTPSTPLEIYQNAQRAARDGRPAVALELLEIAAKRGVLGAQVEYARVCATAIGGPRDDAKAFYYYKLVADGYADIDRSHLLAHFIGEAFRMTATYLRTGIQSAHVEADPDEAARLMLQSASYFRDRIAQYELSTMYLNGEGVEKNPKIAVTWLVNSARKRYAPAQALLGDMLWRGRDVKRSRAEGLAFMALARDNAQGDEKALVATYYANALAEADNESIRSADEALKVLNSVYRVRADEPPLTIDVTQPGATPQAPAVIDVQNPDLIVKDTGSETTTSESVKAPDAPSPGGRGFGLDGAPAR